MNLFFWLSIALWMTALITYALILASDARTPGFLYRTLVGSAIGAMVTGGLYLVTES